MLVSTTGENLNLNSNPCSKALCNEAGPSLQAECSKKGKLQVGEVAVTSGGNLLCHEVYHVVCVQWNAGQGEKVYGNPISLLDISFFILYFSVFCKSLHFTQYYDDGNQS